METKNLPKGFKELEDSFENFVALNPTQLDKDLVDKMRNQFKAITSQPKFEYPPPLIKVVENGHFDLKHDK